MRSRQHRSHRHGCTRSTSVRARHSKYDGDQRQCSGRDECAEKITQDLSTWTCGTRARAFPSEGLRCVLLEPRCPEADLTTGFTRTSRNRGALVTLVVGHQGCAGAPVGRTPAGDPPSAERGLPNWATEFKNARQPFLNPSRIPLPGIMPLCTLQFPATGAARGDATGVQGGAPFSSTVQNLYKGCYENFGPAPLSPVVVRPIPRRRAPTRRRSVLQRIA